MSLAAVLIEARRMARQVAAPLPAHLLPPDAEAGYAIAAEVAAGLGWDVSMR